MPEPGRADGVKWARVGAVVGGVLLLGLTWNAFDDEDEEADDRANYASAELTDEKIATATAIVSAVAGRDKAAEVREELRAEQGKRSAGSAAARPEDGDARFDAEFDAAIAAADDARDEVRGALADTNLSTEEQQRVMESLEF